MKKSSHVFERYETKFLMSRKAYESIMEDVRKYMELDTFGHSLICNIYYDTPDFKMIRRSLDHPLYKEKIRVRSYGVSEPDGKVYIELKKKYEDVVYKRRASCIETRIENFFTDPAEKNTQIAREIRYTYGKYEGIGPRMYISYEREAYYLKDGDPDFRVTFDENIRFRTDGLSLCVPPSGERVIAEDQVLMELKCAESIPFWMVRALSREKVYKTSFSKYGTAYVKLCKTGEQYAAVI